MARETMRRLDEIVGSFREGVIVRVSCGGMLCGECIQCTARAAKVSLQREQRAAQDEIARLTRELEEARALIRELAAWPGLVWTGTRVACAYCGATARYGVEHDRDCLIERARRALAKDTEVNNGE